MNEKRNIENEAVCTDIHKLIDKSVEARYKPLMITHFSEQERIVKKLDNLERVVLKTSPQHTLLAIDNIITKAAIIVLYILILIGCTGSV